MSRNILIFSLAYYPKNVGGAEVAIHKITDRISAEDIVFHMVTHRFYPDQPAVEQIGNITVHRIGSPREARATRASRLLLYISKMAFIFRAGRVAVRLHKELHFDGLWAMMSYMTIPIMLMRLHGVRIPYAITLQEGDTRSHVFHRLHVLPFLFFIKKAFRHATVVQVISTFLGDWARELGYKSEVSIIPNGVDIALFGKATPIEDIERIQSIIGKKEGEVWLIHTGRFVKKNALDSIVRALPLLPLHIHFFALGEGDEENSLRALAKTLGVIDRYHTHPYVDIDTIPQFLRVCNIFIRPSRSEGMGNSFVEAMAAGIPVIGTAVGGITDFLFAHSDSNHPQTGWIVGVDSPKDIRDAVLNILQNETERTVVCQNAKALVTARYDWDTIAREMQSRIFESLWKKTV